jgi:hypothetical protein
VTARLEKDAHTRLNPEEKKAAYANRFRPSPPPPLPTGFTPSQRPLTMIEGSEIKAMNPRDIQPRDLVAYARKNSLPVLERLYEIAMMDAADSKELSVVIEAAGQFLNRAGLYEIKGQVAVIHAKYAERSSRDEESERIARAVDVNQLTEGLGPKGPML